MRVSLIIVTALTLAATSFCSFAIAQENRDPLASSPGLGGEAVNAVKDPRADRPEGSYGSVAQLEAAALETVGYHLQEVVFDELENGWGRAIGTLLFTVGAAIGLTMIGLGGSYKFGLWWLFGPALTFTVLDDRVQIADAEWIFGHREYGEAGREAIKRATEGLRGGDSGDAETANVSYIFAAWNKFTTALIREFINFIELQYGDDDLNIVEKGQVFFELFALGESDQLMQRLISYYLADSQVCAAYFAEELERMAAAQNSDGKDLGPPSRRNDVPQFNLLETFKFADNTDALYKKEISEIIRDITQSGKGLLTCNQFWEVLVVYAQRQARTTLNQLISSLRPNDQDGQDAIRRKLAGKFAIASSERQKALKIDAGEKARTDIGMQVLVNYVAIRMIVHGLQRKSPALLKIYAGSPRYVSIHQGEEPFGQSLISWSRSAPRVHFESKGIFMEMAHSMPHIQGMILCFLGWSFPLFAFVLVVPGRHHTFILWFGLWFWVKSWDIGYAMVGLLDRILFAMLPMGPALLENDLKNPAEAIQRSISLDPNIMSTIYYTTLASAITAVPLITGVFIKKGGGEILNAVNQGFSQMTGIFGTALFTYHGSLLISKSAGEVMANVDRAIKNEFMSAVTSPGVLNHLFKAAELGAAKDVAEKSTIGNDRINKAIGKMAGVAKTREQQLALSELSFRLTAAAYAESSDARNLELAANMQPFGYSSHDFSIKFGAVGDAMVDYMVADTVYPGLAGADGLVSTIINTRQSFLAKEAFGFGAGILPGLNRWNNWLGGGSSGGRRRAGGP